MAITPQFPGPDAMAAIEGELAKTIAVVIDSFVESLAEIVSPEEAEKVERLAAIKIMRAMMVTLLDQESAIKGSAQAGSLDHNPPKLEDL